VRGAALLLAVVLAACGPAGGIATPGAGPFAPGVARGGEAVDGLTVGHRMMAAGEHELALKAYLRGAAEQGPTPDVLSALGSANLRLGRLGQAEQLLRRALEREPDFVPALNNLGVVLIERGQAGEARQLFERAFALDSGRSDEIRENLRLAIARIDADGYSEATGNSNFALMRRGYGHYLLLSAD